MIHCFKKEQPCESGSGILKEQFEILKGADRLDQNPFDFEPTDSDVEEANDPCNIIDQDDPEDDFVDVLDL